MYRGHRHSADIGAQHVLLDSDLEERVLRWLEENGFSGRWRRLPYGLEVNGYRYTPDIEILIILDKTRHRALVEIKPEKSAFEDYHSKRFRKIRRFYHSKVLLLYAEKEKAWYRINIKTGDLEPFSQLVPADTSINSVRSPFSIPASNLFGHGYRQPLQPFLRIARAIANSTETILVGSKKMKKISKSRHRKTRKK